MFACGLVGVLFGDRNGGCFMMFWLCFVFAVWIWC